MSKSPNIADAAARYRAKVLAAQARQANQLLWLRQQTAARLETIEAEFQAELARAEAAFCASGGEVEVITNNVQHPVHRATRLLASVERNVE